MTNYEYRVHQYKVKGWATPKVENDKVNYLLNSMSGEGWELYDTTPLASGNFGMTSIIMFTFRRELK